MSTTKHCIGTRFRQAVILGLVALIVAGLAPVAGAITSTNVAYVTDFGTGSNDPLAPPSTPGSSIFVNALTGVPPLGTYTTADATKTVTIVDVPVSVIDASPATALAGFDTVILFQVCDIGSHPNTMTAINNFLVDGGKVMIFDSDRCSGLTGFPPPANYSTFLFPFTASTPGPEGAAGSYTNIQPSTLTTGLVVGPQTGDSVGDANTFVTFNGNWCGSITATNTLGNTGFVEAYARTPDGGLVIYEGEDFWFTFGPTPHLRQVFDLMLKQNWDPDGLPCALPASGISLAPPTQTHTTGTSATVTAHVVDANDVGQSGITVTFHVTSGPNFPTTSTSVTDGSGNTSFTYGSGISGTDTLNATFVDILGNTHTSNNVTVLWNTPPTALCKNVTVSTAPGVCSASASVNNGSFDPDAGDTITLSQSPPGPYAPGTTTVTLTVTDNHGASSTCTGTVTVVDTEPPTITCSAPVTVECTGNQSASATFSATASDNCGAAVVTCPGSSGTFPLGTTTVTCTATDTAHNTSSCNTTVTVVDTKPPVVTCIQSMNPSGSNIPTAHKTNEDGFYKVSASDVCSAAQITLGGIALADGETIKITQSPGQSGVTLVNTMGPLAIKHFQVGPGDATITATDSVGNTATVTCLVPPPPK